MPNLTVLTDTVLIPVVDVSSTPTNKHITAEVLKTFTADAMASSQDLTDVQTLANVALDTKANIADLSSVAFSGEYADILNTPDLNNWATVAQLDSNVVSITNNITSLWVNAVSQGTQISALLNAIQFRTIANSKGSAGDTVNMVAIDSTAVYFCKATYTTGAADIWVKTNWGTTGTW